MTPDMQLGSWLHLPAPTKLRIKRPEGQDGLTVGPSPTLRSQIRPDELRCAPRSLNHDQGASADPTSDEELGELGADYVSVQLVRRVSKDNIERLSQRLPEHLFDRRNDDLDSQPECFSVALAELRCSRVALDQQHSTGATTGRLQPDSARAGVQIAKGQTIEGLLDRRCCCARPGGDGREQRLAYPIGGRSGTVARRHGNPSSTA